MILGFPKKTYSYQLIIKDRFNYFIENIVMLFKSSDKNNKVININKETKIIYENRNIEDIMSEYGDNILRLSYSYLHNMSDAEDILQDTLIQYLKIQPEFENQEHEKAWLLRVAINLSKNKIKYNKLRITDELSDRLSKEEEDLSFVWESVKELPDKYREVIHLYYQEGYSTNEIAEILSKNESTVRSLLHRARTKLKEVLGEVYDFE